jgi:hypothetical protein
MLRVKLGRRKRIERKKKILLMATHCSLATIWNNKVKQKFFLSSILLGIFKD